MDKPFYQMNPTEFFLWLTNFLEVVNTNIADLPITPEQFSDLMARRSQLQNKINAVITKEQELESANIALGEEHKETSDDVSYFNTTFKADKSIPRELLAQMGLKVSQGKTSPPPNEPLNLTVSPNVAGYTDLKWDKNGNKPNTIYDIEGQYTGSPDWVHIESVNGTKYRHLNQQVGKQVVYRVRARRAGQESVWCSPAVAYYQG